MHQWKTSFNPAPLRQAHEVIFSRRRSKLIILTLFSQEFHSSYQKHLGMFFDSKLDFDEQIKGIFDKTSKSIGLIRKLRNFLPRPSRQIYKSFVRPYLYYSYIIYDKALKVSFQNKPESVQYNVALATTWTIRRTSRKKTILSNNHSWTVCDKL